MPFRAGDIGRVDSKQSHFLGFSILCLEKHVGTWQQIDKTTIEIAPQRPSLSNQNNKILKKGLCCRLLLFMLFIAAGFP